MTPFPPFTGTHFVRKSTSVQFGRIFFTEEPRESSATLKVISFEVSTKMFQRVINSERDGGLVGSLPYYPPLWYGAHGRKHILAEAFALAVGLVNDDGDDGRRATFQMQMAMVQIEMCSATTASKTASTLSLESWILRR